MNTINIIGRITRDVELKDVGKDVTLASFTLAVDRARKNADGVRQTDFIDCVAWRRTAEFLADYVVKGQRIGVAGTLQVRQWTDDEGKTRRKSEVVVNHISFADGKKAGLPPEGSDTADNYMDGVEGELPF